MITFITNICPHYRVRVFELIAERMEVKFLFFSDPANVKNWERRNPVELGRFDGEVVPPFRLGPLRLVPGLYRRLLTAEPGIILKCINGRIPLLLTFLIARLRGMPFVLWTELWRHPQTPAHRLGFPLLRLIYRNADAIVAGGFHVRSYLEGLGVDPGRIFVAVQAVDRRVMGREVGEEERRAVRLRFGAAARKLVLFVGRLEPLKGIEDLLEAMRDVCRTTAVTLVAAGEGSLKDRLRAAEIPGLELRLPGYLPNGDLPALYAAADVFVLPSRYEVWGLVLNEALLQACPVITTSATGAAAGGLVLHERNGLVVPPGDVPALSRAIGRLLGDEDLRSRLSRGARETAGLWTQENKSEGFLRAFAHAGRRRRPRGGGET